MQKIIKSNVDVISHKIRKPNFTKGEKDLATNFSPVSLIKQ